MPGRILVIRGGAIGDFILTLPAIRLIREAFPEAHLEILGYRQIAALAEKRYYADATRSIEYGPLAGFFNPKSDLNAELVEYFSGFHQVISYIFDPDALFASSLGKAGVKNLIAVSPKVVGSQHAARHLAEPLSQMALWLDDPAARFFPREDDLAAAATLMGEKGPYYAVHPGSGSEKKNWPLACWTEFLQGLQKERPDHRIVLIGGECDGTKIHELRATLPPDRTVVLDHVALPTVGALLARCAAYFGHDTGISHLAAASGARCLLLFGPTDPAIWAPTNPGVRVVRAPRGDLSALSGDQVRSEFHAAGF